MANFTNRSVGYCSIGVPDDMSEKESKLFGALRFCAGVGLIVMMVWLDRDYPWYLYGFSGILIWGIRPPQAWGISFKVGIDALERLIRAYKGLPKDK